MNRDRDRRNRGRISQTSYSYSDLSNTSSHPMQRLQQPGQLEQTPGMEQTHIRRGSEKNTCSEKIMICLSYVVVIITFPFSMIFCLTTASVFVRKIILRLGRVRGVKGPGLVFTLPCVDDVYTVDLRTQSFDIVPQEVLTKDSVTVKVDAVVYFKIINPMDSVIQVYDVHESTQLLAQTTLRNVIGTKNLVEILTAKETLSKAIEKILDEATDPWGVKVERVEMKDLRLPATMQRAMAAEAEAIREAKAKIIAAEGELNSSKALKEASDVMAANPITLQKGKHFKYILIHTKSYQLGLNICPNVRNIHRKQIELPLNMQRAMAIEQEAVRQADAKVVAAQGELVASQNLKLASDVMKRNPLSMQLRYLQTINAISNKNNHTIIVPFPYNMIKKYFRRR